MSPVAKSLVTCGRLLLATIAALAVLALAACGGGNEPDPVCPSPRHIVVALYGDSTMRGPEDTASPYRPQKLLQSALDERFGRGAVRVDLFAFGGTEVFDLVAGARGFTKWGPLTPHADVVVMNFGVNEAANGVTVARYRQGLTQVPHRGMMLQTPGPMRAGGDEAYAQAMREVAREKGYPVIGSRAYVLSLPGWVQMLEDGIHPTGALYELIVRNVVAPAVGDRVAVLRCAA